MAKKRVVEESSELTPQIVRANLNRAVERSPSFASLYANDLQVQVTPWDVRLILGEIASVPTSEDQTVLIREVGELRLSPQLAKRLTLILIEQLRHYEDRFGQIPIPKD